MEIIRQKKYTDSDPEVKQRLRQLRDEDQGHPTLLSFFLYEGYKVGSALLLVIFVVVFIWSLLSDGFSYMSHFVQDLRKPETTTHETPTPLPNENQKPSASPDEEPDNSAQEV